MIHVVEVLLIVSALDLIINFFFHLVQFKRYCDNEVRTAVDFLIHRVDNLDRAVVQSQRDVQTELHDSIEFIKGKINDEIKDDGCKEHDGDTMNEFKKTY